MPDLHDAIMNLPCHPDSSIAAEVLAFKRGHKQARHAAAELAADDSRAHEVVSNGCAAVSAIAYAMSPQTERPLEFLKRWHECDFAAIRREWPDAPEAVFVGSDPHYKLA